MGAIRLLLQERPLGAIALPAKPLAPKGRSYGEGGWRLRGSALLARWRAA